MAGTRPAVFSGTVLYRHPAASPAGAGFGLGSWGCQSSVLEGDSRQRTLRAKMHLDWTDWALAIPCFFCLSLCSPSRLWAQLRFEGPSRVSCSFVIWAFALAMSSPEAVLCIAAVHC